MLDIAPLKGLLVAIPIDSMNIVRLRRGRGVRASFDHACHLLPYVAATFCSCLRRRLFKLRPVGLLP